MATNRTRRAPLLLLLACSGGCFAGCPSSNPGDSAKPQCDDFCAAQDKAFDCSFCRCQACDFCSRGGDKTSRIAAAVCNLGVTIGVAQDWGTGFRLEVVVRDWRPGAVFTLDWKVPTPPTIKSVFAADLIEAVGSTSVFRLRSKWDENHGFG